MRWVRFILRERREEFEAVGWRIVDALDGTHHGTWSVLGEWEGEGDPPQPKAKSNAD